jgi:ethanolamine ammonia-lyase large subunit
MRVAGKSSSARVPRRKARQTATESQTGTLVSIEAAAVASYTNNTSDRITTQNESSFTYDGNGGVTSDGIRTYTYDQEADGRVLTATASGLTASHAYDPFGRVFEDGERHDHSLCV